MSEIRIAGLTKYYGDTLALKGLDLTVKEGDFVTLLGPSGCGKTTTLRCIAGLERPDGGEIVIGDRKVNGPNMHVPAAQRNVGLVFQAFAVWPHMTVFDNVAYPLRIRKASRSEIEPKVESVLSAVGLSPFAARYPGQLSGGQQQRVALARAIVADPVIILYDEPLSNLDARLREEIRYELRALHDRIGTTALYVTHDQLEAMTLSDRVCVMHQGNIVQADAPVDLYERPANLFVYEFLGSGNVFSISSATPRPDGQLVEAVLEGGLPILARRTGRNGGAGQHVGIRPHRIRLATEGEAATPGRNRFEGVIDSRIYMGDRIRYSVRISEDCTLAVEEFSGGKGWNNGDAVVVTVAPEDCLIFS